ncbi:nucleoside-diphosphate sugar epimerase [Solibacillus sp. MA9]|uniref:Nucleoside-diphosphate sugar epimerase n=1 Tax=Solibacillus palustris TaxID=2908203 RepID=A0ABS9UEM5_9BACL|nr:nucleoside-diphosphate sugar epimerase [Solibacillus sp. MA9]MCH7322708.1 nucleoside-diphosphate sugar epimerase [Solibacillus sp. MA9]
MDLQSLTDKLQQQILQQKDVSIEKQMIFSIPVHTLEVIYHPVMRNAMDILMKMMLISLNKARLTNAELLADILLVEPLFIHDLTNKMLSLGMIKKEEAFSLTAKGEAQLASGIFEEELDETSYFVQYSPLHEAILEGDLEQFEELEQFPEVFPTIDSEEIEEMDEAILVQYIQQQLSEQPLAEGEVPSSISSVVSSLSVQINDVPVICFMAHNDAENQQFARVYNTLTGEWDAKLEALLFEFEKAI